MLWINHLQSGLLSYVVKPTMECVSVCSGPLHDKRGDTLMSAWIPEVGYEFIITVTFCLLMMDIIDAISVSLILWRSHSEAHSLLGWSDVFM